MVIKCWAITNLDHSGSAEETSKWKVWFSACDLEEMIRCQNQLWRSRWCSMACPGGWGAQPAGAERWDNCVWTPSLSDWVSTTSGWLWGHILVWVRLAVKEGWVGGLGLPAAVSSWGSAYWPEPSSLRPAHGGWNVLWDVMGAGKVTFPPQLCQCSGDGRHFIWFLGISRYSNLMTVRCTLLNKIFPRARKCAL